MKCCSVECFCSLFSSPCCALFRERPHTCCFCLSEQPVSILWPLRILSHLGVYGCPFRDFSPLRIFCVFICLFLFLPSSLTCSYLPLLPDLNNTNKRNNFTFCNCSYRLLKHECERGKSLVRGELLLLLWTLQCVLRKQVHK